MKRNRILKGVGGVLSALCLIGIYVLNYFTEKKMGMARHMAYLNGKWEMTYPLEAIKMIFIGLSILLFLLSGRSFFKTHQKYFLIQGVFAVVSFYLMLFFPGVSRAYHGSCFLVYLSLAIQWIAFLLLQIFKEKTPQRAM